MSTPTIFLDRDGIVNELVLDSRTGQHESPTDLDDVVLIPGAAVAIWRLAEAGFRLAVVTNQPAAAKGFVELEDLAAIHGRVLGLLVAQGVEVDTSRLCLHHPDGVVAELAVTCDCRKPRPGMILDAAAELDSDLAQSWMIGDSDTDVEAGQLSGCRTVLVDNPRSAHRRAGSVVADIEATSLDDAVTRLLAMSGC